MADSKITALTALTAADPANDMIPIVDVSDTPPASGNTKRISINNILACSPSATLASATITGDLTVRTDKLAVRSTGVGIGTTTPNASYILDLTTAYDARARQWIADSSFIGSGNLANGFTIRTLSGTTDGIRFLNYAQTTEFMRIDSSGNVGIGVTPSAWGTYKGLQVGYASLAGYAGSDTFLGSNVYFDGGAFRYISTATASNYRQLSGVHQWNIAPSGTAGNSITFTQAMTLDASGNLLVGTTGQNGSWNTKLTLSNDSGTTKWAVGPYLGGVTNFLISAGASAGVYLNGTAATSWTSASDERLKDIIEPISDAIAKVGSLRAVIGKFKFDENNTRKPFLIAQDIQAVLPEAVDASNPEKLGVAYTDVIPLLVAAIKELTARVQTLETR